MNGAGQKSFPLFRIRGIQVFLHWSWFLMAAYEITERHGAYSSVAWNILEYLTLFVIVLLHEFGHAVACRLTGGFSNRIVLWPLGGIAYVKPPLRPGAMFWSIAAGPLVNATLIPIFWAAQRFMHTAGLAGMFPDAFELIRFVALLNVVLLRLNLLPIYPLDGGQMLRSLLWFALGRARSLMAAALIGVAGAVGVLAWAIKTQSFWWGLLAGVILFDCWRAWSQAQALLRLENVPRHAGFYCPACKSSPPYGKFWQCGACHKTFDTFQTWAVCPHCSNQFETTACFDCGRSHAMHEWTVVPPTAASAHPLPQTQI